jgi:hypothetical protein
MAPSNVAQVAPGVQHSTFVQTPGSSALPAQTLVEKSPMFMRHSSKPLHASMDSEFGNLLSAHSMHISGGLQQSSTEQLQDEQIVSPDFLTGKLSLQLPLKLLHVGGALQHSSKVQYCSPHM